MLSKLEKNGQKTVKPIGQVQRKNPWYFVSVQVNTQGQPTKQQGNQKC